MHGGLFSRDDVTLDDIRSTDRNRQPPEDGIMCELLWSDPQPMKGRSPSKRGENKIFFFAVPNLFSKSKSTKAQTIFYLSGVGIQFGPDVTARFLERNHLDYVVRSHEVKADGYEEAHDGKCITVFSAPNYW